MTHHPAPNWFKVLAALFPGRCREIPEATDPGRVLLRQFAIVKRVCYLQQFASGENPNYYHRHEFQRMLVIVLRGSYIERRPGAPDRLVIGPCVYTMDDRIVHQVDEPSASHTSIFLGLRRRGERTYFRRGRARIGVAGRVASILDLTPIDWRAHVKRQVERI